MFTGFAEMEAKIDYMMEAIRIRCIEDTLAKWKESLRKYYTDGCDTGESVRLFRELQDLGADIDTLFDIDFEIMYECTENRASNDRPS